MSETILLVGAGIMAQEYAKVLKAQSRQFTTVGRSEKSAQKFFMATDTKADIGGIAKWLCLHRAPKKSIIAVSEKELGDVANKLISAGCKEILCEKPGGYNAYEIKKTYTHAKAKRSKVFIAYNRRFYASVQKAKEIIKNDGGVLSFFFDFTEWGHKIPKEKKISGETHQWFLNNSTHVIDLAFYLCSIPKKISCFTSRGISWHPNASVYTGSGVCKNGALFSYHANWESGGRWGIDICTKKHRLILRPLEKLHIQDIGSVDIKEVPLNDQLDLQFKPGLFLEVQSFLSDKKNLPTIQEQIKMLKFYEKINKKNS